MARRIYNLLIQNNINVCGFLVDKEYHEEGMSIEGKPVNSMEAGPEIESNVVLGFVSVNPEKEEYLRNHKNVRGLYALDFGGGMVLEDERNTYDDDFLKENREGFIWLFEQLADFESKCTLLQFLAQKYTGMYRKEFSRTGQYFDAELINVDSDEIFVDCGAYNGDTVFSFIDFLKSKGIVDYKHIFAFEADPENYTQLCGETKDLVRFTAFDFGVWNKSETLFFNASSSTSSQIAKEGISVKVTSIDEMLCGQPVTFIKMDVEGAELKAIQGAEKTIRCHKPKLSICVYHKKEDLLTIPKVIKQYNPDYKLYLRSYSSCGFETVLYAL